jgi:LPXTG-motif cell wall-anchored protein
MGQAISVHAHLLELFRLFAGPFGLLGEGEVIMTMAMEPRWRRVDTKHWFRLGMAIRACLLVATFLVGGIIALATGHTGSGQAGLALAGVSALLLLAGWLRSRRQRPH